uniref:RNase H type-1 domain-containing protein n=1 Tax=Peronospora matthiolae TaxID=2874970 RepID=A0AAV1TJ57_9STRA
MRHFLLRTHRSLREPQLAQFYDVARGLADDVAVVSWGHHYRDYNKMADCAANIAMDTCSSIQVRILAGRRVVKEVAAHVDKDVNHWIETSTNGHADTSGSTYTEKDQMLPQKHLALRGGVLRGTIIALDYYLDVCVVILITTILDTAGR